MVSYKKSASKLFGVHTFTIEPDKAVSDAPLSGTRRYTKCSVISIPQPNNRKPKLAIMSQKGMKLLEVSPRNYGKYAMLEPLVGCSSVSLSWCEKYSQFGDGNSYLDCKLCVDSKNNSAKTTIPRIVLDTETTGLDPIKDEIIQLSIIDGNGYTLLNEYYKPKKVTEWPEAQRVNGISPEYVANKKYIVEDFAKIQSILDAAGEVCAFNAEYDLAFLGELGFYLDESKVTDTMRQYGKIFYGKQFIKLTVAAAECNYYYNAHDSLADCKATLVVQNRVDEYLHVGNRNNANKKRNNNAYREEQNINIYKEKLPSEYIPTNQFVSKGQRCTKKQAKKVLTSKNYKFRDIVRILMTLVWIVITVMCTLITVGLIVGSPKDPTMLIGATFTGTVTVVCYKKVKKLKQKKSSESRN